MHVRVRVGDNDEIGKVPRADAVAAGLIDDDDRQELPEPNSDDEHNVSVTTVSDHENNPFVMWSGVKKSASASDEDKDEDEDVPQVKRGRGRPRKPADDHARLPVTSGKRTRSSAGLGLSDHRRRKGAVVVPASWFTVAPSKLDVPGGAGSGVFANRAIPGNSVLFSNCLGPIRAGEPIPPRWIRGLAFNIRGQVYCPQTAGLVHPGVGPDG